MKKRMESAFTVYVLGGNVLKDGFLAGVAAWDRSFSANEAGIGRLVVLRFSYQSSNSCTFSSHVTMLSSGSQVA
jgi:hypothetical protein